MTILTKTLKVYLAKNKRDIAKTREPTWPKTNKC